MGPPSFMRSVVDRNVVMRRIPVIRLMHCKCWVLKATNTYSEYVIHIAFPLKQWLYERVQVNTTLHINFRTTTKSPNDAFLRTYPRR
jgi:hypothetical protein